MSTKEKTGSAGRTAGVLFILLALAAVAVLGVYIYRQLQPPKAPETAIGYVASETASAPVYDADSGAELGVLVRGSQVAYVAADVETPREDGRVRVVNGEGYVLLDASHLADDLSRTVQVETVYALRGMSLLDETGAVPGCAVEKGMALAVTGFDGLDENGEVLRWQGSCQRGEGYIAYKLPKEKMGLETMWPIACGMLHNSTLKRLLRFGIAIKRGGASLQDRMDKEKKPYIFVGLVCVREKYQGQGYMRKVLNFAFAEGDRLGVPVILETDAKSKCDKYVHLGMELAGMHDLGAFGKLYDLIRYPEPTKANGTV